MTILPMAIHEGALHDVGEALMPAVPAKSCSFLRTLSREGELPCAVGADIAYLHLAAHVCLYGFVPEDVHLSLLPYKPFAEVPEPRIYVMCASRDPVSLEWVEAARAGLDSWREAGFSDPLDEVEAQRGNARPVYPSYETLRQHSLNRLKVHGCLDMYLRLKRHAVRPPLM